MSNFNSTPVTVKTSINLFLKLFIYVIILIRCLPDLNAQAIKLIPNAPTMNSYAGIPYVYNNLLSLNCLTDSNYVLGIYDGNNISLKHAPLDTFYHIAPDYVGYPFTYKNNLYADYTDIIFPAYSHLGKYDNVTISFLPGTDTTRYSINQNFNIVYHNKIYYFETYVDGNFHLAAYDGTTTTAIPNPTPYGVTEGNEIIYNDKLYFTYQTLDQFDQVVEQQLASYDGSSFILYPNVSRGRINPLVPFTEYHNKLYFQYSALDSSGVAGTHLAQFDGTNISLVPDVNKGTPLPGHAIIYNDTMFIDYWKGNIFYLAKFDGTTISVIPNPNKAPGYIPTYGELPIIYNNKLYIVYEDFGPVYKLAEYTGNGLKLISNPDLGIGYFGAPIVHNNKLYIGYATQFSGGHIGVFDGSSISLIPAVDTFGGLNINPYFINYQNKLYFDYDEQLAYLDDGILAVSLLNFSAQLQNNNAVLNWQTASEVNTAYFNIQRSSDGAHFTNINKIIAAGNSSDTKVYTYTDANVTALKQSKLYYRLQEIDKDGKSTYSNIQIISWANSSLFTVSPNPAKDFVNIVSSYNVSAAQVKITNMIGKTLFTSRQDFIAGQQLKVSLSKFPGGVFFVTIVSNDHHEQFKIVKE